MNRYPRWKYILILAVVLLGLVYTVPNFFGESPAVQVSPAKTTLKADTAMLDKVESALKLANIPFNGAFLEANGVKVRFDNQENQLKAKDSLIKSLGKDYTVALNLLTKTPSWLLGIGAKPMSKGLDLQGGVHFLLQVDMKAALTKAAESSVGDFRTTLRREKINYMGITRDGQKVSINFESADERAKAYRLLSRDFADFSYTESGSGKELVLTSSIGPVSEKKIQEFALKQNLQTLHNRINELGVAEPIVQQQGFDRIVVQLPGVQDTAKAKEILGRTATLEIRMVDEDKTDFATLEGAENGKVPFGDEFYKDREGRGILVKKNVVLTGDRITDAGPGVDNRTGRSIVNVTLDARGAGIFKNVTRDNVGKRMAILLIEKGSTEVVTAPTINEEIGGGRVQISGMDNPQEATDISLLLRAGALAAPMEIIEERTVGPSMGEENIKRGVHSTLWGFAAIAVMMIVYYMVFGGVSVLALGVNLLLLVALLSMLQATLTLPGLAAIALALGMAIDANVLINERIREELRNGNTPQACINEGYKNAWHTIVDSNVTTLIAGLALFMFGTGPIKGFAVVHVLGILTSMFSAVLVSRAIVNLIYGYRRKLESISTGTLELFKIKSDIPFMSYGKLTTAISLITFILAVFFLATRGLNYGVDFTGGTVMEVQYPQAANIDGIRKAMDNIGLKDATVQNFGTSRDVLIRLPVRKDISIAKLSEKVGETLKAADANAKIQRVESVGSQVGEELYENGALALMIVCAGIMAYLALRFEWRFAVAAIIANMHDVVIILGFFAFFQWEFNLTVLAAVLAVLGYSVNESVVVFDRVRENFRKMRKASVVQVIDNAITRTMSRTVITHLMTQTMVCSMLFFGGEVLHNFALALTIGILFGIYSSVLVASPIAMWLGVNRANLIGEVPKKEGEAEGAMP